MKYWVVYANDVATSDINGLQKVIKIIHWRRKYVSERYMVEEINTTHLPDPDANSFKKYEELNFEDYCNWIESIEDVVAIDQRLEEAMYKMKNPQIITMNLPFDNISIDQNFEKIALGIINDNTNYGTSGI